MPTACIRSKKKEDKGYCGDDIPYNYYAFGDPDYAFYHYDIKKSLDKNPNRMWACPKCIAAITTEKEKEQAEPSYLNSLIGAQGGTK